MFVIVESIFEILVQHQRPRENVDHTVRLADVDERVILEHLKHRKVRALERSGLQMVSLA